MFNYFLFNKLKENKKHKYQFSIKPPVIATLGFCFKLFLFVNDIDYSPCMWYTILYSEYIRDNKNKLRRGVNRVVDLLKNVLEGIKRIRDLVEHDALDEDKYPLEIFRTEAGIIQDLIDDLQEAIAINDK